MDTELPYRCCCGRRFAKGFGMHVHQRKCPVHHARTAAFNAGVEAGKSLAEIARDEQAAIDAALKEQE